MSLSPMPPPRCWAEIDCAAIRHNAAVCRDLAGDGCDVMAIVKADAYGHGLERVGRVLAEAGVMWFGVASVEEAIRLADMISEFHGILILSPTACDEERELIVRHDFSSAVSSTVEVAHFSRIAEACGGQVAKLHVSVDTGMGRMGVAKNELASLVETIGKTKNVMLEGVATHFPSADEDADFTVGQIKEFNDLISGLNLPDSCRIHLANSAGLIGFQESMPQATLVRPGLAIYGITPLPDVPTDLRPTLSLKTRITLIRDLKAGASISYGRTFTSQEPIRVATLAVGYGDGYPRHLSGSGIDVLVGGKRCPLLGRVTMDQIVVDVSGIACGDVQVGDEAVLIGDQGDETISTEEIAVHAGTIPWEILTGLTNRVKRVYQ